MRTFLINLVLAAVFVAAASGARAASVPAGFSTVAAPGSPAQALVAQGQAGGSILTSLQAFPPTFAAYFDGPPRIVGALADRQDDQGQAIFVARLGGQDVTGLVIVSDSGPRRTVVVVHDLTESFATSARRLFQAAGRFLPSAVTPATHEVRLADGSTMRIPEGWRVTASGSGVVDLAGPEGAAAGFGGRLTIFTQSLPPYPPNMIIAPYSDPVTAVLRVGPQTARRPGMPMPPPPRIVESWPVAMPEFPQGQAAFVHFTFEAGQTPQRALALVITAPAGSMWMYYVSQVTAPDGVFQRRLPEMLQMWRSWRVSDRVLQERLQAATRNLAEIGAMVREGGQDWATARERAMAGWDEYIRDVRYERDTATGQLQEQPLHGIGAIIEAKNAAEGYQRYVEVPLAELWAPRR